MSGRPGAGKTTLAHLLARRIGCPAICRDEITQGMAHATGDFVAAPGAEAAFQDRVWQPQLQPLPEIEVDTSGDYRPDLDKIISFLNAGR